MGTQAPGVLGTAAGHGRRQRVDCVGTGEGAIHDNTGGKFGKDGAATDRIVADKGERQRATGGQPHALVFDKNRTTRVGRGIVEKGRRFDGRRQIAAGVPWQLGGAYLEEAGAGHRAAVFRQVAAKV